MVSKANNLSQMCRVQHSSTIVNIKNNMINKLPHKYCLFVFISSNMPGELKKRKLKSLCDLPLKKSLSGSGVGSTWRWFFKIDPNMLTKALSLAGPTKKWFKEYKALFPKGSTIDALMEATMRIALIEYWASEDDLLLIQKMKTKKNRTPFVDFLAQEIKKENEKKSIGKRVRVRQGISTLEKEMIPFEDVGDDDDAEDNSDCDE